MKKIIALLTLLMVALAPIVAADEAGTNADTSEGKTLREKAQLVRAEVKDARAVKADIRPMRLELRADLKAHREELELTRKSLADCKGQRTEDCDKKRTEGKVKAKRVLMAAADEVTEMLNSAKARVEQSDLSNKAEIAAEIDAQITNIASAKAKVEALTETSTREEILAASKELRQAIAEAKKVLRVGAHNLVNKRLSAVIQLSDNLDDRLEKVIAKLQEKGVDTSSVDLASFDAKVEEAEKFHAAAKASFEAALSAKGEEKETLMKQAHEQLRQAHAAIKEAHKMLREIVAQLKKLNADFSTEARTEAKAEVESESGDNDADESSEEQEDDEDDEQAEIEVETNVSAAVNVSI